MIKGKNTKIYDLEERTFKFAKYVRKFVKDLPRSVWNSEDAKQLVRASGSVGANYIEANECFSKKDFVQRIRISRKESKEVGFRLRLIDIGSITDLESERQRLINESIELMKIFSSIMRKSL